MISGRSRSNFRDQIRRQNFLQALATRVLPKNPEQPFKLRIPGFDSVFEINREHSDVERLDDILAEILEALDLHGLLFERLIKARILKDVRDVAANSREKLKVIARKIVSVNRLAKAEHRDSTLAEAARDEVI